MIRATLARITAAATRICTVIGSWRMSHPRKTATTGFTYA